MIHWLFKMNCRILITRRHLSPALILLCHAVNWTMQMNFVSIISIASRVIWRFGLIFDIYLAEWRHGFPAGSQFARSGNTVTFALGAHTLLDYLIKTKSGLVDNHFHHFTLELISSKLTHWFLTHKWNFKSHEEVNDRQPHYLPIRKLELFLSFFRFPLLHFNRVYVFQLKVFLFLFHPNHHCTVLPPFLTVGLWTIVYRMLRKKSIGPLDSFNIKLWWKTTSCIENLKQELCWNNDDYIFAGFFDSIAIFNQADLLHLRRANMGFLRNILSCISSVFVCAKQTSVYISTDDLSLASSWIMSAKTTSPFLLNSTIMEIYWIPITTVSIHSTVHQTDKLDKTKSGPMTITHYISNW